MIKAESISPEFSVDERENGAGVHYIAQFAELKFRYHEGELQFVGKLMIMCTAPYRSFLGRTGYTRIWHHKGVIYDWTSSTFTPEQLVNGALEEGYSLSLSVADKLLKFVDAWIDERLAQLKSAI